MSCCFCLAFNLQNRHLHEKTTLLPYVVYLCSGNYENVLESNSIHITIHTTSHSIELHYCNAQSIGIGRITESYLKWKSSSNNLFLMQCKHLLTFQHFLFSQMNRNYQTKRMQPTTFSFHSSYEHNAPVRFSTNKKNEIQCVRSIFSGKQ